MKRRLILLALPAVLAALLGACGGSEPTEAPADAIVMTSTAFEPTNRSIKQGETITLVNETDGALHILVIGDRGVAQPQAGAPDVGGAAGHRSERGEVWTTPSWDTPGNYGLTCTVHPEMTLAVTVTA